MHPFGRTPERSGQEQGVYAVREALKDAGIEWSDVQFAFGGSQAAGAADTMVSKLGLTGLQFINVANGCATGGSALFSAYNTIGSGAYDLGMAVGYDKHERGAFRVNTRASGLGDWYGKSGMALTTQFFGMKINRYMEKYDISHSTLAKVSAKAFRNAEHNPNAWRRQPISEEQILESEMLSYPLTKFMFCSPARVAWRCCWPGRQGPPVHRHPDLPQRGGAQPPLGLVRGHVAVDRADDGPGPTVDTSKAAFEMAGMGPEDIDLAQLQDTEAGAEIMHMAENGFCADGEQERMIQDGETEIGGRFPVNTDGGCLANGEPVGGVGPASGVRERAAAAGPGRQAPGPQRPEGGLHPRLRRPRDQRRHHPQSLTWRRSDRSISGIRSCRRSTACARCCSSGTANRSSAPTSRSPTRSTLPCRPSVANRLPPSVQGSPTLTSTRSTARRCSGPTTPHRPLPVTTTWRSPVWTIWSRSTCGATSRRSAASSMRSAPTSCEPSCEPAIAPADGTLIRMPSRGMSSERRVVESIDQIMADHVGERVVVACHGGVINGYLAHAVESSIDQLFTVHHTSITTVRAMDELRWVVQVNDYDHVRPFQTELNPANAL